VAMVRVGGKDGELHQVEGGQSAVTRRLERQSERKTHSSSSLSLSSCAEQPVPYTHHARSLPSSGSIEEASSMDERREDPSVVVVVRVEVVAVREGRVGDVEVGEERARSGEEAGEGAELHISVKGDTEVSGRREDREG
jgi:hypothetical protein